MQLIDWIIVLIYLFATMALGLLLSHRETQPSEETNKTKQLTKVGKIEGPSDAPVDFNEQTSLTTWENKQQEEPKSLINDLIAGRNLPWWLAGTSMAATTFSIDTPLYICGVVASRGIAGNWEWWSFGIAHIVLIYVFAGLWRRSEMVTDAELTELRYGGATAAILRATKAFLFAVPINCIGIGYAMLAMVKVVDALQLWQSLGFDPGEATKLWTVIALSVFVLIYTGASGLWGVVVTDFFQFFLGLFGATLVAIIAVGDAGGMHQLIPNVQEITNFDVLSFIPISRNGGLNFTWNDAAGITATTFSAYIFVQWWSFRRSDGGGEFVQRLLAVRGKGEEATKEAEKATWFFNILHYIVRTWPWIVTALAAMVLLPNLEDAEIAYPMLMLTYLPSVVLGLVVASLIAAFMSTISTSINWGASYLTNDLYRRFFRPQASEQELTNAVRLASVLVTVVGSIAAFYATDVRTVFRLVIAIGTGPGLVLILRWFWWRINAAAELSAMIAGFVIGLVTTINPGINNIFADFGWRLLGISVMTAMVWVTVMYLTPPEEEETLLNFYSRVRPGGIGWKYQQYKTGLKPAQNLGNDILKVIAAILVMFGSMFAIGGFLLLQSITGFISLTIAICGGMWLSQLNKKRVLPMPRPGLDDVY